MQKLTLRFALSISAVLLASCGTEAPASRTQDIFAEDAGDAQRGNARRHPATEDERLWTINMGGCTGHLITPDLMMTASHCSAQGGARYQSGYATTKNNGSDITVTQVVEDNQQLDYAILKVQWVGAYPKEQKFPPLVPTKATDVTYGAASGEGDEIFTVGFPGDKTDTWGATYSEGRLKGVQGDRLVYNMGIINGNSGGGVWRKRDKMLVSLTNGGPNVLGQGEWNSGKADDASHWNNGAAMWEVYAVSKTLQDVFPNGKNRFASETTPEGGGNSLFVAIGAATPSAADSVTLHATAPAGARKIVFCQTAKASNCREGASGYTVTTEAAAIGGRAHFKGSSATTLQSNMTLSFVALNADGKTIASRTVKFTAR